MTKHKMKHKIYDNEGKVEGYLNTETARFLAGTSDDRDTRGSRLFMTPRSKRFFLLYWSMWQGEGSSTKEIDCKNAIEYLKDCGDDDINELLEEFGEQIKDIE